jgi:hypothetical protein
MSIKSELLRENGMVTYLCSQAYNVQSVELANNERKKLLKHTNKIKMKEILMALN